MSSEQEIALNYFSELAADERAAFMRADEHGDADEAAAAREPDGPEPFVDLADVERGAMMPDPVLPRLAWRDSVSVLFGAPKIGKSTLLGQAVGAAVTGREFLGESAACGQIAIVTEEPIRLAAARLHKYGIPEEHHGAVFLVRVGTPGIEAALQRMSPALIVFDSLAAWLASVGVERFSDAGAIRAAFNTLRRYADAGAAVLTVHHSRKSDDAYADSRDIAVEALARGAALASPDDAVRLGSASGGEAVDLTAGTPVLVLDGMPGLPTAGVVFAGRRLVDLLAHTKVNANGLSALACVATVPVPDDVDAKGRPRDTAIVPGGLFPDAPAVRFVSVQDRGDEARLALPGRAQDPELPLLAASGLVDEPPAAPMLALVNAAGLGAFASGRGARLDKRFLIYSLASMPLAYRQPGARYEHRQPLRWWANRLFGKHYRPNKHGPMMLAGLEGLIYAKVQLPDGTYWRPVLPRQDPDFGNLDSPLQLDIALPDACDRGAAVPWQPLIDAGRKSDSAFDLVLGLAFLWDRAKAANGGRRIYATRPKSRRNHAGALVDAVGNVITTRANAPRRGKTGWLAWPAGDVPVRDWRHPAAVIDGVERHPNADRVPALTREGRRRLVFPNVAMPVQKSARSNQRAAADALIEALAVALPDAPPRIVIERLPANRWRLLEVAPAGAKRAFP